jgi:hypothetical protein
MAKITPQSAKAKGRRLQKWVAKKISEVTKIPHGKDELIESREMGQAGSDIKLYGKAKEMFLYSVECKFQETWSVPKWIKDAKKNQAKGSDWLLFMKRNHHEEVVVMDAAAFFDLYEQLIQTIWFDE